jgi:hypothetical protein
MASRQVSLSVNDILIELAYFVPSPGYQLNDAKP